MLETSRAFITMNKIVGCRKCNMLNDWKVSESAQGMNCPAIVPITIPIKLKTVAIQTPIIRETIKSMVLTFVECMISMNL